MSEELQKSRRKGIEKHFKNPFMAAALASTKHGTRRISPRGSNKFMIVSESTGEIVAPAGFHEVVEVDKSQFVKLYINGVKALQDLTAAGTRLFAIIYIQVQERPGQDKVILSFSSIDQAETPISRATFDRGMREMLEKGFIAESTIPSVYFINVDYLFNGNRLAFIKEYRLVRAQPDDKRTLTDVEVREQLEQRGQLRLDGPTEAETKKTVSKKRKVRDEMDEIEEIEIDQTTTGEKK